MFIILAIGFLFIWAIGLGLGWLGGFVYIFLALATISSLAYLVLDEKTTKI